MKKLSSHYDDAVARLAGVKSIDENLDLGGGISAMSYETGVLDLRTKLDSYNTFLSLVDEKLSIVQVSEKNLKDLSERILAGVAARYGKHSDEYVKAGGTRKGS